MASDLGCDQGEVHEAASGADAILRFWLDETPPEQRFARDDALDRTIARRFGSLIPGVIRIHAAGWRATPRHLLAAVILIDQFARNIHRNSPLAFAGDPLARALTGEALSKGWDSGLSVEQRQFLYMPLMHAEALDVQLRSLRLFEALGDPTALDFARRHAVQIARFGRFPQRNAALGRDTTPAEAAFLTQPGARF